MAWRFDNPLYTLADERENQRARELWESEDMGGTAEGNNRVPRPVVALLALVIVTAFLMTFPLWGQRPKAEIFEDYIALMDSPEVQAIESDAKKMEHIVSTVKSRGSEHQEELSRHPVDMDDLRLIKDDIVELQQQNARMNEYFVVGDKVVLATHQGSMRADGTQKYDQPWWDKGFTIDVFYVSAFILAMVVTIKRLPHFQWQPKSDIGG